MVRKLILYTIFLVSVNTAGFCGDIYEDTVLADRLQYLLKKEYTNYKNKSLIERIIMELGKKAFFESVDDWRKNYQAVEKVNVKIHPQLEELASNIRKHEEESVSNEFRVLLTELTRMGYRNIDMYYVAVRSSDVKYNTAEITLADVDEAMVNPVFFLKKKGLYEEEREIKKRMREIMTGKRVKGKLGIYLFAFDFLNKIREDVIEKDLAGAYKKLLERKKNSTGG